MFNCSKPCDYRIEERNNGDFVVQKGFMKLVSGFGSPRPSTGWRDQEYFTYLERAKAYLRKRRAEDNGQKVKEHHYI